MWNHCRQRQRSDNSWPTETSTPRYTAPVTTTYSSAALEGLWDKADRYRRLALQTERTQAARDQKANEHQLLVDFIAAGDSDAAANVMHAHIDTSLGAAAVWRLGHETAGE